MKFFLLETVALPLKWRAQALAYSRQIGVLFLNFKTEVFNFFFFYL